jgi:dTDP-4-amino-4,6-dideoxygalactose transaminase
MEELKRAGIGCSVHWRPLHLHPYYEQAFGWQGDDFPVATAEWRRLISLPIFPGMSKQEISQVIEAVHNVCAKHSIGESVLTV